MKEQLTRARSERGHKDSKAIKGGLLVVAGVFAAALQVGGASAVENSETALGVDSQVALGAEVDVLAQCAWYLDGVDSSLTLLSADDGLGGNVPYIGDALTISAQDSSVELYFSGSITADDPCGIYVDGSAGIDLTVELATLAFVGSPDTSMNFSLDGLNPLNVDMDVNGLSNACSTGSWDDYTASSPVALDTATTPETVFGIADSEVRSGTYSPSLGGPGFLPNCDLVMAYSTQIPAGLIPDSSGSYTFTGPAMTVTIVNSTPGL